MSWNDYYRRRDALDAVVHHAARATEVTQVPYDEVPEAVAVFADRAELMLALHYRWTLKLTGRVGLAQADAEHDPSVDLVDAVTHAWRTTATEFPVLRRLVDVAAQTHPDVLAPALESEQRMLALAAGLAEPHERRTEITRIGGAFLALVRTAPDRAAARRRNPVELLLRRLVASA